MAAVVAHLRRCSRLAGRLRRARLHPEENPVIHLPTARRSQWARERVVKEDPQNEGSAALVPESIEVQAAAVDKAAPAARATADRITQWFKRGRSAPHARAAAALLRRGPGDDHLPHEEDDDA